MIVDMKQATVPFLMPEPDDIQISLARLLCNIVALMFSLWYAFTRHFLANNGMGLSYSIEVCPCRCRLKSSATTKAVHIFTISLDFERFETS